MKEYKTPKEFYFRLHHIRPRFKNNVEEVLLFVASEISNMEPMPKKEFNSRLNRSIKLFPGNAARTQKTINNWRTEISSLFGFILCEEKSGLCRAGQIAQHLSDKQDFFEFFKFFLYSFQYPGGHLKPHEAKKLIENGVKFRPAQYIIKLLDHAEKETCGRFGISKAEATHCIFNDLRVTRDGRDISETLELIASNRKGRLNYDCRGDIIRYAGDILDYMVYANLLVKHGSLFYLNRIETPAIATFESRSEWFDGYDIFYGKKADIGKIKKAANMWFVYVNNFVDHLNFETDVLSYIGIDKIKYEKLEAETRKLTLEEFAGKIEETGKVASKTKEIGDTGENLVHGHECMRLKIGKREDLIPKVVCIPNKFAMGFDVRSFELDAKYRLIEVKTTISNAAIDFNQFHMTDNEWNAATTYKDQYWVYRLMISRARGMPEIKMFVLRNPVELYKKGLVDVKLSNGADIKFSKKAGNFEGLMIWTN